MATKVNYNSSTKCMHFILGHIAVINLMFHHEPEITWRENAKKNFALISFLLLKHRYVSHALTPEGG